MNAVQCSRILSLRKLRNFSCSPAIASGHNKWSKIKHDKARVDATINKQRRSLAQELQIASRINGPDINTNPRLATAVATAKKQGFPKLSIENAIKRGQGVSPNGAALESVTLEAMIPPAVAIIMECQTDGKARLLQNVKTWAKNVGGVMTPVSHLFFRTGRIVLENTKALTEEDVLDHAVDTGATDVFIDDDGNVVIHTEPEQTTAAARLLSDELQMKTLTSDIVWKPRKELKVDVEEPEKLQEFITRVQDDPSVQQVYVNAK